MKDFRPQRFVPEGASIDKDERASRDDRAQRDDGELEMKPRCVVFLDDQESDDKAAPTDSAELAEFAGGNDTDWRPFGPLPETVVGQNDAPPARPEHINPIAGLDNLGNTCYANSVLQVLRFTPGFTAGLRSIVEQMEVVEEKLQEKKARDKKALDMTTRFENGVAADADSPKDDELEPAKAPSEVKVEEDDRKTWRVVRLLRDLFDAMSAKDFRSEGAGSTAPKDLLGAVREVNPMFEENIQQDAPEFLHCLLTYVQEASKQIFKLQEILAPPPKLALTSEDDDDDEKMEDDNKSDKSDTPSTSSGYDSDPAIVPSSQPTKKPDSSSTKKSKKTLFSKGQLRLTSMFAKSPKGGVVAASAVVVTNKTISTKRNANGTFTRIISPQKGIVPKLKASSHAKLPVGLLGAAKTNAALSLYSSLHPAKRRRTGSPSRARGGGAVVAVSRSVTTLDEKVRDKVQDYLNVSGRSDIITRLFEGKMVIKTRCQDCDTCSERTEPFQDLSVPVRLEDETEDKKSSDSGLGSSGLDMSPSDDLGMFSDDDLVDEEPRACWPLSVLCKAERLVDQNKYACDVCRAYTEAVRTSHYQQLPPILNIHLKRFSATMGDGICGPTLTKINDFLSTPFDLPASLTTVADAEGFATPTSSSSSTTSYKLFAIIMHQGTSLSVGHYTAYVRVCRTCFPKPEAEAVDVAPFEGEYDLSSPDTSPLSPRHRSPIPRDLDAEADARRRRPSGRPNPASIVPPFDADDLALEINNNGDENGNVVPDENMNGVMDRNLLAAGVHPAPPPRPPTTAGAMSQSLENLSLSDEAPPPPSREEDDATTTTTTEFEGKEEAFSWFECDDVEVRRISAERLALRLAPSINGAVSYATPYMLLYARACH